MRITERDIRLLDQLRAERTSLEQREKALRERILAILLESPGNRVERGSWTCTAVPYAGQPHWKDEYVKLAGERRAAALAAKAPQHHRVEIVNRDRRL